MTESAANHRLQGKSFRSPLKAYTERLLAESGRVTVISLWLREDFLLSDRSRGSRLDVGARCPPVSNREPQGLQREWSLMNVLNQKGTRLQDKPMRLGQLPAEDQKMIFERYPELKKLA